MLSKIKKREKLNATYFFLKCDSIETYTFTQVFSRVYHRDIHFSCKENFEYFKIGV